jgi:putative spermidine/putrescine transport system permease protein
MTRIVAYLVAGFILLPSLAIIAVSFTTRDYTAFPPQGFTLHWYGEALKTQEFIDSFKLSIMVAVAVALLSAVLGTAASLSLRELPDRARMSVMTVVMTPMVLPAIIIGISLLQFFAITRMGLSPLSLVIGHLIVAIPYVIRFVSDSLRAIPPNLEWAAASLGAPPWRAKLHIVLPGIWGGVLSGAIFAFMISFENVTVSTFLASPGMTTLPVLILGFASAPVGPWLVAACSMSIVFTIAFMALIERLVGMQNLYRSKRV